MANTTKEVLKELVFKACEEDPGMLRPIIDMATAGVKSFADKQSDSSSKIAFMMSQVLDQFPETKNFGPFKREEILDRIKPWFDGTPWFKKQIEGLIKQKCGNCLNENC